MFQFLETVRKSTCSHLAEIEPHFQDPTVDRPSIFNYLQQQGHNENTKKYLNQLLINVVLKMKHGNGAPYDPKTVAVKMHTLFAKFSKQKVPFKLDNFSGFPGAMQDVIDQIWKSFCENDGEFGRRKKEAFLFVDYEKIVAFISNLSAEHHSQWILEITHFALGVQLGLRGRQEHRDLQWSEIVFDRYPDMSHSDLAGKEYVMIRGELLSKTNQVTFSKFVSVYLFHYALFSQLCTIFVR